MNKKEFDFMLLEGEVKSEIKSQQDYLRLVGVDARVDAKLTQVNEKLVNNWLTKVNAKLTQELSDKEKKVVFLAIKNKKISSADCQRLLKIKRVMANRYFKRLIEKGLLMRKGVGKSTYYVLVKRGEFK